MKRFMVPILVICSAIFPIASAQTTAPATVPSATAKNSSPTFEVVSIHSSKRNAPRGFKITMDGYSANDEPISQTILMAYFPLQLRSDDRIKGAPSWVLNDSYDFTAKVASDDLPQWQKYGIDMTNEGKLSMLHAMLQAALTARCDLVLHRIPAEALGYALVVDKKGPNLKAADLDEPLPKGAQTFPDGSIRTAFHKHGAQGWVQGWTLTHSTIGSLINLLQITSPNAPVLDQTGLTGKYDFELRRNSVSAPAGAELPAGPRDPSLVWDLETLGLKILPIKIQTETLVIDHIDRPSDN
jgi:uncharacterized protein (TIGR03435 family)